MADAKTINGYNVKDAAAREAIANLDTVKLASEGGASGSIRFGVDSNGKYGYFEAGADTVTPFSEGGDFEETVLWTNSDPTSMFPEQDITGLPNISQYDYIGVYYIKNRSTTDEMFAAIDYEHFKDTKWDAEYPCLSLTWRGSNVRTRGVAYVSDTSVHITFAYLYMVDATTASSNSMVIPTKIVGINKGKQGLPDKYTLIKTGTTGTVTFDRDYDQLLVIAWGGGSVATYVQLDGVTQPTLGLNSNFQTDVIIFDYKANTPIYIRTDPSGYKIFEIYKE